MNSLKKASGTFKGLAGECMFRIEKNNTILTHFQPKEHAEKQLREVYTKEQIIFLLENWDTIDAINTKKTKIYEIKTMSCDYGKYKIRIMANCHNTLLKAHKIGIKPILAKIKLEEDWLYKVVETDYLQEDCQIVVPSKYNKPYSKILG
ncbi:MAG: hypothetical protein ABH828_00255 [archaeon]